jgi:hypothetical protein
LLSVVVSRDNNNNFTFARSVSEISSVFLGSVEFCNHTMVVGVVVAVVVVVVVVGLGLVENSRNARR